MPEKGVDLLIAAARLTGLPLRLAGDAPSHPAIRPGDPVQCIVTRARAELGAFYRGARMLVVPSLWFETFCIVGAEAMSHGIPVVAARLGALCDLIDHERTGLLFNHFRRATPKEQANHLVRQIAELGFICSFAQTSTEEVSVYTNPC